MTHINTTVPTLPMTARSIEQLLCEIARQGYTYNATSRFTPDGELIHDVDIFPCIGEVSLHGAYLMPSGQGVGQTLREALRRAWHQTLTNPIDRVSDRGAFSDLHDYHTDGGVFPESA